MSKAVVVMTVVAWVSCPREHPQNHPTDAAQVTKAAPDETKTVAARDCSDEPGMVYVPSEVPAHGERHRYTNGKNDHVDVEVAPFWLDRLEVTVEEFRACVDAGACTRSSYVSASGETRHTGEPIVCTWDIEGVASLPINCIDRDHADEYCAWKRKRVPLGYEWTWAAMGRHERRMYPWGDDPSSGCDLTIATLDEDCGLDRPWPVGSRPKDVSRDGVLDMGGNVAEIVLDRMPDDPPFDGPDGAFGGSWQTPATNSNSLHDMPLDGGFGDRERTGFRCAKDPGPRPPCSVAD